MFNFAKFKENSVPKITLLKEYSTPDFFIDTVDLVFELGEDFSKVKSHLVMHANPQKNARHLMLDGEALTLLSVALNGKSLANHEYQVTDDHLIIQNVPRQFTLDIETKIKPQENKALSGLYQSSGNFCTQCEAQGFRRITYYLDRPDVMAKFTTKIIADENRYPQLLSNGNLIAHGKLENGLHWAKWEDPFKKPSYLFALVAGNFELVEDFFVTQSGRKVTLRIYVEKGNRDKCAHAMQAVKKAMKWDEENFGREYDLDIYMIVAVSDFNMGAMENKGLNIFNTKYILAKSDTATDMDFIHVESVIAHEYFHNWSGNRITCRDWFQLSLKEGLTIFRDQSFTTDTTSKTVARIDDVIDLRAAQFPEDAGPLAHPVQPDSYIEINNFYTATIYNKGSEVIRMMKTILGEQAFRAGMDIYFSRYDGQAVTIEEFVKSMEEAGQIDLQQFRLWYKEYGTPELTVIDEYHPAEKKYLLTITQHYTDSADQARKPLLIPIKLGLIDREGKEIAIPNPVLLLRQAKEAFEFDAIVQKPIPSLLRGFSAPVKLQYHYTDDDLKVLFKHDADGFNRWEAGQKYALNCLLNLVKNFQQRASFDSVDDFIATFKFIAASDEQDKLLLAKMLILPSEKYISAQMAVIDVDAVHAAREHLMQQVALGAKELLLKLYQDNFTKNNDFNLDDMAKRQLKNLALSYLMKLPDNTAEQALAIKQFKASISINMTDTIAALSCLNDVTGSNRHEALVEYYDHFKHNALALDKWFAIQAMSNLPETLQQVKILCDHAAFDIKNPNKVYALIRSFCQGNPVYFHSINGEGYAFLRDIVLQLNGFNPQIAARMVAPLTEWKRYDATRQTLMRKALQAIAAHKNLSKDVYELVEKSL